MLYLIWKAAIQNEIQEKPLAARQKEGTLQKCPNVKLFELLITFSRKSISLLTEFKWLCWLFNHVQSPVKKI